MDPQEIINMIQNGLPGSKVEVVDLVGDRNHYQVTVTSPIFEGKSLVIQHQMVYKCFGDLITSGALHALSVVTKVS